MFGSRWFNISSERASCLAYVASCLRLFANATPFATTLNFPLGTSCGQPTCCWLPHPRTLGSILSVHRRRKTAFRSNCSVGHRTRSFCCSSTKENFIDLVKMGLLGSQPRRIQHRLPFQTCLFLSNGVFSP